MSEAMKIERVSGLGERLNGVFCSCGGEIWFENLYKKGKATRDMAWEAYCRDCKACDANGYSSRKKLLAESPSVWGEVG